MDLIRTGILLIHPLMAIALIAWIIRQYGWKRKSRELTGEERIAERDLHERRGEIILWSAIGIALMGFLARIVTGWMDTGDPLSNIMPTSLHGWTGPLAVILLWIMARWGRDARTRREEGEPFGTLKEKHGRAADLIVSLMVIHAFLGFLYIFSVI